MYIVLAWMIVLAMFIVYRKQKILVSRLEADCRWLTDLRESRYQYFLKEDANRIRVSNSDVKLEKLSINKNLIIEDTLDIPGDSGINIYEVENVPDVMAIKKYTLIAYISLSREMDQQYKIEKLFVEESYRRLGVGSFMMKRVAEWSKLRELSSLYLFASASSESISQHNLVKFYEYHGFEGIEGAKEPQYMHFVFPETS